LPREMHDADLRAPGFITDDSQGLEFKAERKPLGITG